VARRTIAGTPFPRAFAVFGFVGVVMTSTIVMGACGTHRTATGFCATVQRGHGVFNSSATPPSPATMTQFDRIAGSAPAAVAADLETVGTVLRKPAVLVHNPSLVKRYFTAIGRVDDYLGRTCGIAVPPLPKRF
jgi:hypothetical protein